jgi:hypothetical protein
MTSATGHPHTRQRTWIKILEDVRDHAIAREAKRVEEDREQTRHLGSGIDTICARASAIVEKGCFNSTATSTNNNSSDGSPAVLTPPSSGSEPRDTVSDDCGFDYCNGFCKMMVSKANENSGC